MINRMTSTIALICALVISTLAHNPQLPPPQLKITLVTAWWPQENNKSLPVGEDLAAFEKLLKLPYNIILFGENALGKFVQQRRGSNDTVFFEHTASALRQSWYSKLVAKMKDQAQALKTDTSSSVLAYSRMILLGKAGEKDTFDTEEFIWVDHNALKSAQISNVLDPRHLYTLFQAFSHNFFMVPVEKDNSIHAFPGIEQTLFFQKYDTFVSSQIFGGTVQTISTAKNLYEDMLKVVLEYDKKLWNEDVMLGLFADRFPYTVSYMTVEFEAPQPPSRLLEEDTYLDLQKEYDEIKNYELMFELCQLGFLITGALIAYEIFKYLKLKNQLILINSGSHFEMEPPSPAQLSTQ